MNIKKFLLFSLLFSPTLEGFGQFNVESSVFLSADRIAITWDDKGYNLSLDKDEHAQFNRIARPLFKSPLVDPFYDRVLKSTLTVSLEAYDEDRKEFSSFMRIPISDSNFSSKKNSSEFYHFIINIAEARKEAESTDPPPPAPVSPAATSPAPSR